MDFRRCSDASTFVTPADDSERRLLEEFTIDDSHCAASNAPSHPLPLLYTPAYNRTYKLIRNARIAIFALSFPKFVIPVFGAGLDDDTLIPFLPIAFISFMITWIPLGSVMHESWVHKNQMVKKTNGEGEAVKGKKGDTRTAVLVEDPVTGEERWMLQAKATEEKDEESPTSDNRTVTAVMDVCCGLVFLLAMFFAIFWGLDSPKTLTAALSVMVLQL
jgi:hypothetical protein